MNGPAAAVAGPGFPAQRQIRQTQTRADTSAGAPSQATAQSVGLERFLSPITGTTHLTGVSSEGKMSSQGLCKVVAVRRKGTSP